jgi:hypothetical protein
MRGSTVSFLSYTFRQLEIKSYYRAVCLLKKLTGMTVYNNITSSSSYL